MHCYRAAEPMRETSNTVFVPAVGCAQRSQLAPFALEKTA